MIPALFIPIKIYCKQEIKTPYEVSFDKNGSNLKVKTVLYNDKKEEVGSVEIELPMEHVTAIIGAYAMCVKQMVEDPKDKSIPMLKI